jgi:acyl carrier protein
VADHVHAHVARLAPGFQLDDETPLLDLGLVDSAELAQLVAAIEERFDLEIADEDLTEEHFGSIRSMVRAVEEVAR